jgi:hypothetical protein
MADNSNSITRLAIHNHSIIATKHNFSDFGNIQTKKRSLLKIEKVHKTNVLWMDISRCHAELGLTEPWGKRKLGASEGANCVTEAVPSDFDDNDNNKFGSLASRLINAATDANTVINNIADMADAPISSTDSQPCHHRPTHTQGSIWLPKFKQLSGFLSYCCQEKPTDWDRNFQADVCQAGGQQDCSNSNCNSLHSLLHQLDIYHLHHSLHTFS